MEYKAMEAIRQIYEKLPEVITVANHLTLVTHNTAEFSRIPNLGLDDWES